MASAGGAAAPAPKPASANGPAPTFFIQEYRVEGTKRLKKIEVEEAVYGFLGPERMAADVEGARAALEKAYRDKGFETVSVSVPPQDADDGIVVLRVTEATVGRLRVRGSRYFDLDQIKRQAPSLAEGTVPSFPAVQRDIVTLNQLSDRRVTPSLRAGVAPGTVDVDLTVQDTLPLHGSLEVNNRRSAGTTPLRVSGAASYNNLWQLGHSLGGSFQIAPQNLDDARVFSGFYTARFPTLPGLSLTLQGTRQDSNVSTLGGASVAGRGFTVGGRANLVLPGGKDFYHSVSLGADYKRYDQDLRLAGVLLPTPISYVPLVGSYFAAWTGKGWNTDFSATGTFNLRGLGSDEAEFGAKRFRASASFATLRLELSHVRELPGAFQAALRAQGQVATGPVPENEGFSGGGLSTVRGYLESAVLGDHAGIGSVEVRTPSLHSWLSVAALKELRLYAFVEGGLVAVEDPLPEQTSRFWLGGYGVGGRLKAWGFLVASLDLGLPLVRQGPNRPNDPRFTFRVSAEF